MNENDGFMVRVADILLQVPVCINCDTGRQYAGNSKLFTEKALPECQNARCTLLQFALQRAKVPSGQEPRITLSNLFIFPCIPDVISGAA